MTTKKLKDCPFCGSDDVGVDKPDGYWVAGCDSCGANSGDCRKKPSAISAWNRRPDK